MEEGRYEANCQQRALVAQQEAVDCVHSNNSNSGVIHGGSYDVVVEVRICVRRCCSSVCFYNRHHERCDRLEQQHQYSTVAAPKADAEPGAVPPTTQRITTATNRFFAAATTAGGDDVDDEPAGPDGIERIDGLQRAQWRQRREPESAKVCQVDLIGLQRVLRWGCQQQRPNVH